MLSKLLTLLIGLPLAILLVVFCVVNRHPVTISLDIFGTTPQFALTLPTFVLLIICVIIGLVLGGLGTWLTQAHYRSKSSRRRREIENLRHEVDVSRERIRRLQEERETAVASRSDAIAPDARPALPAASNA